MSHTPRNEPVWNWELKMAVALTDAMQKMETETNTAFPIHGAISFGPIEVQYDGEVIGILTPSDTEEWAYQSVMAS